MNEQQITDRLVAAHAAYVETTGKQPYIGPKLDIDASGNVGAYIYPDFSMKERLGVSGKGLAATLNALDAAIAAIPSAEDQARNEAAKAVANAIEKCRAAGYDGEVLNPLADLAKRISENALTFEVTG